MKVTGKILEIQPAQQISDSFKKRNFVLEYVENPQYPEYISFEVIQDRCSLLEGFQANQEVEVSFNLKGRKWINPEGETKYFNSLQAWRVEAASVANNNNQPSAAAPASPAAQTAASEEDELPF
ncbi:MAG: DUF3127 domain-containing protein [Bacteroidota bacterium]